MWTYCQIEEMLPIRQKTCQRVGCEFGGVNRDNSSWSAAQGGHPINALGVTGHKQDRPIAIPAPSPFPRSISHDYSGAARHLNGLKLVIREETERAVIWRLEWTGRSFRPGHRPGGVRVQGAGPKHGLPGCIGRSEGQGAAIGRECGCASKVAGERRETGFLRGFNFRDGST